MTSKQQTLVSCSNRYFLHAFSLSRKSSTPGMLTSVLWRVPKISISASASNGVRTHPGNGTRPRSGVSKSCESRRKCHYLAV